MKIRTSILAGVVAGSLGLAPTLAAAQEMSQQDTQQYDSRKNSEEEKLVDAACSGRPDDRDNRSNMSRDDVLLLEEALADDGYDPGTIDGVFDDQTQAAISEFQSDHAMVATGIVDAETGELLGIVISEPS